MSDGAGLDRDDEADLAAEYALGVLDGAGRRAAERRMAREPAFARAVADWERRLGPMAGAVPAVSPPADLWSRIEADLARMTRAAPRTAAVEQPRGRRVSAIWQYIGLAGMGIGAASAAALILVVAGSGGLLGPPPGVRDGAMTATLAAESGAPLFTLVYDAASGMATLVPVATASSDPAHVHELWLVPPGGAAPRSLGILASTGPMRMRLDGQAADMPRSAIAVSLEPAGGSPTGLPTGPVVASGALTAL